MKVLVVNKFLYPKGGVETYIFQLGRLLESHGHEVQYFGLRDERNIVGNRVDSLAKPRDFQGGYRGNLLAPFQIIYSSDARRKLRAVLTDFQPDVVHFNNIQYHLTPSVILEADAFRRREKPGLKIIYTAHDFQLVCPSHGLFDRNYQICERCLTGEYGACLRTKCLKNSYAKSFLGMLDACYWRIGGAYRCIDTIICPSAFLKQKLDTQERFAEKTVVLRHFADGVFPKEVEKGDYVLIFGKLCREKGTYTVLKVCQRMPGVRFLFAGYGSAVQAIQAVPNAEYVGFQTGAALADLIMRAKCSVCASEIYENCPLSVMESQLYGTPVVGSRMGGIPELIHEEETGVLFRAGDDVDLERALRQLLDDPERLRRYAENGRAQCAETSATYYEKLMKIYEGRRCENL